MAIRWAAQYFNTTPQVIVDGLLYILIALSAGIGASLNNDEAAKFVPDYLLFWAREVNSWLGQAFLALKLFRSTTFAEHVAERKASGNTGMWTKATAPQYTPTPPKD